MLHGDLFSNWVFFSSFRDDIAHLLRCKNHSVPYHCHAVIEAMPFYDLFDIVIRPTVFLIVYFRNCQYSNCKSSVGKYKQDSTFFIERANESKHAFHLW